jgi:hypothetical protein
MASGKEDDSLFWDILTCLIISDNARLQWFEIRDTLFKKYEAIYDKESFETVLSRFLKRVAHSGYIKKDSVRHQEVYYYIPKRKQKEVVEKLDRRFCTKNLTSIGISYHLNSVKRRLKIFCSSKECLFNPRNL